jgi:methionyl-tRNA formyltransferase
MRIVMMGTGMFAEPTFERLLAAGEDVVGLVTQPDRDAGNKRGSTRQAGKGMKTIAAERGIPVVQPESINTPEGVTALHDLRPDLMVVAAYGQILSKDVISAPSLGTINVHASLLPKYRGAAPVAYAILNGETRTGVTIIKVTPGLDSGDMILQEAIDILPGDTTGSLEVRLADVGAKLAVEAVQRYKAGLVSGEKQDPTGVTKAPKIKKEQGLIDWNKPAEAICNHVRAMQPWPTAYTFLHRPGKEPMRVIVTKAQVVATFATPITPPTPGRIHSGIRVVPDGGPLIELSRGLVVWAGKQTVVAVTEVQPAGKKKMTADEFLRGYPVTPTDTFSFGPEVLS